MKKATRGGGMAFEKSDYSDVSERNLADPPHKNNSKCSPSLAARDGRNMAIATRSLQGDSNTAQTVFDALRDQYCSQCFSLFTESYWNEFTRGKDGQ